MKFAKNLPFVINVWIWTLLVTATLKPELTDGVNDEIKMVSLMIWPVKIKLTKDLTTDANDTPVNVTESWPLVWVTPGCCGTNLITLDGVDLTEKPTAKPTVSDVCLKMTAVVPTVKPLPVTKTPSLDDLMLPPPPLLAAAVMSTTTLPSTTNAAWTAKVTSLSSPRTLATPLIPLLIPIPLMNLMRTILVIPESK
jgi:hypothetical protein